jgi:hypothetical protein
MGEDGYKNLLYVVNGVNTYYGSVATYALAAGSVTKEVVSSVYSEYFTPFMTYIR